MNWLITGGLGFIGQNFIRSLTGSKTEKIRVLDISSLDSLPTSIHNEFEFIQGDIADGNLMLEAGRGVDIFLHLAAQTGVVESIENPQKTIDANIVGVYNALESAKRNRVKKFIFASSNAALGNQSDEDMKKGLHESLLPAPVSPYGASKLAGEALCLAYNRSYGLNTTSLRFSNVYGPFCDRKNSAVAKMLKQALKENIICVTGDGVQTRDFLFVEDLIKAVMALCAPDKLKLYGGEVIHLGTGIETRILDLAEAIKDIIGVKRKTQLRIVNLPSVPGEVKRNFTCFTKAKQYLKWNPKTPFQIGLECTLQSFLNKD